MSFITKLLLTLCIPVIVSSVTVELDGVIDLGPKWNFKYNVEPKNLARQLFEVDLPNVMHSTVGNKAITRMLDDPFDKTDVFNKPHVVKEDKQINDFTLHVYKQSLKVFDAMKKKVDPRYRHKVDIIARSYDEKFRSFVNETLNQKIKTKLGTQKVVMNTIDTSNRLMKRLVNFFISDLSKEGALRNQMTVSNVLEKEVDKEMALEYRHICTKFGICRTSNGFNNFMVDIFTIVLKGDNNKIRQGFDAWTEVLKATDFTKIMMKSTQDNFRRRIAEAETWNIGMIKAMLVITKNLYALKNQPLKVMTHGTEYIQSTVMLLEIIDEFDKALPPNEENILAWTDMTSSLNQWQQGKRNDVVEILQSLVGHVKSNGIDRMDKKTQESLKQKFMLIFN
ncbi:hypothetical protein evm_005491 [Chilo suppressalis]|nr:hypothetical protein evm_005491 [Chilo suppressalis]